MKAKLTHRSFFSGIGGFDIGAEAAGFETLSTCEINEWNRENKLKPLLPNAEHFTDITKIKTIGTATVFSAGFPCQDISLAGKGQGIFGPKSSLVFYFLRLCWKGRPDYIILENSPALLIRGFEHVLGALSAIGYMCEWQCIQASDFGYPHRRKRLVLIAYPCVLRRREPLFRPIETISVSAKWTPDKAYRLLRANWPFEKAKIKSVLQNDVLPGYKQEMEGLGNAIMPVIAEYLFKCIKLDYERRL